MKRILCFAIAFASAAVASAQAIYVDPGRIYAIVSSTLDQDVIVRTSSENEIPLRVALTPFLLDSDGRPRAERAADRDLSTMAELRPDRTSIDASHTASIHLHVELPRDAAGSYWTAIAVEFPFADRPPVRVMVPVIVTTEGPSASHCEFLSIEASAGTTGQVHVAALVVNKGEEAVHVPVGLTLQDRDGVEVDAVDTEPVLILPGSTRVIRGTLTGDAGAGLTAAAYIRFGTGPDDVAEATATVAVAAARRKWRV